MRSFVVRIPNLSIAIITFFKIYRRISVLATSRWSLKRIEKSYYALQTVYQSIDIKVFGSFMDHRFMGKKCRESNDGEANSSIRETLPQERSSTARSHLGAFGESQKGGWHRFKAT